MTTAQQPDTTAVTPCDLCHEDIKPGERFHDDGSEIAHTSCVTNWLCRNYGRETLS